MNFSTEQLSHLIYSPDISLFAISRGISAFTFIKIEVVDAPVLVLSSISHLFKDCLAQNVLNIIKMMVDLCVVM